MQFQIEPIQNPNVKRPKPFRSIFSFKKAKALFAGALVLLVIALIFFFLGRGSFSENGVDFEIEAAKEISAGDLVTYKIKYRNDNKVDLNNVKLSFFYPQDAIVLKEEGISSTTNENIDIGDLNSGEAGELELQAFIVGDRGNIKTARGTLTFSPSTINSTFKREASIATTITTLAVPITLVAPPTVINGQNVSYLIDYRNQSEGDLENLRFKVRYPEGFQIDRFIPQPSGKDQGQDVWEISNLQKDEGSRITIRGVLTGNERESKTISVTLQKKIETPSGNQYVDFEKIEASSVIATPLISVSLVLNDSEDYTAHLGNLLRYRISFSNNSEVDISNLELSVKLEGNMYDFSTVRSDGFFDSRLNTVFFNGSILPSLNILRPNQSGSIRFEVRLKPSFSGGLGARESFVKATAALETSNVPAEFDLDKMSARDEMITRISTSPTLSQRALLNDSTFGSSGPFPPVVNQKTNFTIRWNLVNPSNDISPAKITAVLAPGVVWENRVRVSGSQPQPVYNDKQRTVTWDLGSLPAGVGIVFAEYETNFQISITPSVNQVNQAVSLLRNIKFEGTDTFTGEVISRTIPDISTTNINDSDGSGTVQP